MSGKKSAVNEEKKLKLLSFRLDLELSKLLELRAVEKKCKVSDIVREALLFYFDDAVGERVTTASRLEKLSQGQEAISAQQEAFGVMFVFWLRTYFSHVSEIPNSQMAEADEVASERVDRFLNLYRDFMKENPAMYNRIFTTLQDLKIE